MLSLVDLSIPVLTQPNGGDAQVVRFSISYEW